MMTHHRWKLLAGFFAVSICCLATFASHRSGNHLSCVYVPPRIEDESSQSRMVAFAPPEKVKDAAKKPELKKAEMPQPAPAPLQLPRVDVRDLPIAINQNTLPTVEFLTPQPATFAPVQVAVPFETAPPPLALPIAPLQPPTPGIASVDLSKTTPINPMPTVIELPGLVPSQTTVPSINLSLPDTPKPSAKPPAPTPTITLPSSDPQLIPAVAIPTFPTVSKPNQTKLTVNLSAEMPTLELYAPSGAFLTLTCESIEVSAKQSKESLPSSIRATGQVKFTSSGCQGECDELVLNPKTMEGTLKNGVRVMCQIANSNNITELVSDQMAFTLKTKEIKLSSTKPE